MEEFKKASYRELNENAIKLIGKEWMLIGAGNLNDNFNMMTASWGGVGWMWEKPVSFIFVRPQRYTYQFVEREGWYTVSFLPEEYRQALNICGSVSGRDCNKLEASGLTAFDTENGNIAFREARIILECRKLFSTRLKEEDFIIKEIADKIYPSKDFHKMYVGEIVNVLVKH